jgi:hypothetical protein
MITSDTSLVIIYCLHKCAIRDWWQRDYLRRNGVEENEIGEFIYQNQPFMRSSAACNKITLGKINIVRLVDVQEMAELAGHGRAAADLCFTFLNEVGPRHEPRSASKWYASSGSGREP